MPVGFAKNSFSVDKIKMVNAMYIFAQATGNGSTTEFVSYVKFLNGQNPKGYYRPQSTTMTAAKRDAVTRTAGELANAHIQYVFASPIQYSLDSSATFRYPVRDIVAVRCDGFVEYAYESNGIKVYSYADSTYWDISRVGGAYQEDHFFMTPKKQVEKGMTRIGSL